ncbi:hypothetical protein BLOT_009889 [Blomia tropicalis]|nr:hypothetical protein BLOT_009889 [Blomia tropicalis]
MRNYAYTQGSKLQYCAKTESDCAIRDESRLVVSRAKQGMRSTNDERIVQSLNDRSGTPCQWKSTWTSNEY